MTERRAISMPSWRKSSYSEGPQTDCVEIAHSSLSVLIRDSKNPTGPVLAIENGRWDAFLTELRP